MYKLSKTSYSCTYNNILRRTSPLYRKRQVYRSNEGSLVPYHSIKRTPARKTNKGTVHLFMAWGRGEWGRKLSCRYERLQAEERGREKPPATRGSFRALTKLSTHDYLCCWKLSRPSYLSNLPLTSHPPPYSDSIPPASYPSPPIPLSAPFPSYPSLSFLPCFIPPLSPIYAPPITPNASAHSLQHFPHPISFHPFHRLPLAFSYPSYPRLSLSSSKNVIKKTENVRQNTEKRKTHR